MKFTYGRKCNKHRLYQPKVLDHQYEPASPSARLHIRRNSEISLSQFRQSGIWAAIQPDERKRKMDQIRLRD